jgi:ABC-2 type transport system permease protein
VVEFVEKAISKEIENNKLKNAGINKTFLDSIQSDINIATVKLTDTGEETGSAGLTTTIGMIGGVLIYMFIFLFGAQVMRGVIEEKTSRIVEVIISSVRPFELMMGKILGIALVGLTQFLLWIVLSFGVSSIVANTFMKDKISSKATTAQTIHTSNNGFQQEMMKTTPNAENADITTDIFKSMGNLNFTLIIGCFLFFFVGGYLLYAALFAAIGSAVDAETDAQQFMLPITLPLIAGFIVAQSIVLTNPDGPVAFWFSIIPFTSPIVMMVRIPFGVPGWEIALSMGLLVLGFMFTTWLAAKIYRTGILLYGKKITYRELGKWLFYKG